MTEMQWVGVVFMAAYFVIVALLMFLPVSKDPWED